MSQGTTNTNPIEAKPPEPQKAEKKYFFLDRGKWVEILSTLCIGIVLGWFGFWLTSKTPHISYTVSDITYFEGEKQQFGIMNITITSDGSKEVESLNCFIELDGYIIQEVKASPENLKPSIENNALNKGKVSVKADSLNVSELLNISLSLHNPNKSTSTPKITVRGKDVVGTMNIQTNKLSFWLGVQYTVPPTLMGIFGFYVLSKAYRRSLDKVKENVDKETEETKQYLLAFEAETNQWMQKREKEYTAKYDEISDKAEKTIIEMEKWSRSKLTNLIKYICRRKNGRQLLEKATETYKDGDAFSVEDLAAVASIDIKRTKSLVKLIKQLELIAGLTIFKGEKPGLYSLHPINLPEIVELLEGKNIQLNPPTLASLFRDAPSQVIPDNPHT